LADVHYQQIHIIYYPVRLSLRESTVPARIPSKEYVSSKTDARKYIMPKSRIVQDAGTPLHFCNAVTDAARAICSVYKAA
jgi:hypothetical protein